MRPIFREDEPTTAGGTAPEIVAARRPDDERGMVMDKGTWWVADQNQKPEKKDGLKRLTWWDGTSQRGPLGRFVVLWKLWVLFEGHELRDRSVNQYRPSSHLKARERLVWDGVLDPGPRRAAPDRDVLGGVDTIQQVGDMLAGGGDVGIQAGVDVIVSTVLE